MDDAPVYITLGDGGNAEGLAQRWLEPQPDWSLYRMASYGHGALNIVNETHALWQWYQNKDLYPVVADEFWITKVLGGNAETFLEDAKKSPRFSGTAKTNFANTERGVAARKYEEELQAALQKANQYQK